MTHITALSNALVDFVFPPSCLHCHENLSVSSWLCKECLDHLYCPVFVSCKGSLKSLRATQAVRIFENIGPLTSLLFHANKQAKIISLVIDLLIVALEQINLSPPQVILGLSNDAFAKELSKKWKIPFCKIPEPMRYERKKCLLFFRQIPIEEEIDKIKMYLEEAQFIQLDIIVLI